MAKDREGSVNIYGAMQAKTAQGIVAYTDGIAHENEDGTVINLDKMLKNGVGGGSAIVDVDELPKVGWSGTTVPNSGICPDIYLNTNLSIEEVKSVLSKVEFTNMEEGFAYFPVLAIYQIDTSTNGVQITIAKINEDYMVAVIDDSGSNLVFSTSLTFGFEGWLEGFKGVANFGQFNATFTNDYNGISVGSQNQQLSSLFSTTPFVKGEEPKDNVFYRVTSKGGEVVPNTGYVEKVYFNTSLTDEEVYNSLSGLTYTDDSDQSYYFLVTSDSSVILSVMASGMYFGDMAKIMSGDMTAVYWVNPYAGDEIINALGFSGWNPNFNGIIEINGEVISGDGINSAGLENSKIATLFSLTSFGGNSGLFTYKDGEYKKVLQEGEVNTDNNSNQKEEINLGSLDLTDVQGSQYMTKNFDIDSDTYNKLLSGNCIPKLTLNFSNFSGISGATSILYLTFNDVLIGAYSYSGNTVFGVYYSTFPIGGVNKSYDNSSSSVTKAEKYNLIPSTDGTNYWVTFSRFEFIQSTTDTVSQDIDSPVTSKGVYNTLQSYAKTEDVNQMIADYITTNFENFNEGEF